MHISWKQAFPLALLLLLGGCTGEKKPDRSQTLREITHWFSDPHRDVDFTVGIPPHTLHADMTGRYGRGYRIAVILGAKRTHGELPTLSEKADYLLYLHSGGKEDLQKAFRILLDDPFAPLLSSLDAQIDASSGRVRLRIRARHASGVECEASSPSGTFAVALHRRSDGSYVAEIPAEKIPAGAKLSCLLSGAEGRRDRELSDLMPLPSLPKAHESRTLPSKSTPKTSRSTHEQMHEPSAPTQARYLGGLHDFKCLPGQKLHLKARFSARAAKLRYLIDGMPTDPALLQCPDDPGRHTLQAIAQIPGGKALSPVYELHVAPLPDELRFDDAHHVHF